jgi:V8-like Glu-specific endopeptidase
MSARCSSTSKGEWKGDCTATLVGVDVVVTAAHCVDFFITEDEPSRC